MKKIPLIMIIFTLIISTALIKNSSKDNEDEIYTIKENLRVLKSKFEIIKLEYDFLSSPDRLLEYQLLYFDDELIKNNILNLKKIEIDKDKIKISDFILQKH
tara:strand:+ start:182 stop:487 length:306 start_codon:yes stop_codon:yes gene_type:complete